MTKDEAIQQALDALPLATFPFKSEPMLYRSDVLAALAQPPKDLSDLLQQCRGSVKFDLFRHEKMLLPEADGLRKKMLEDEADRLQALLDSIDGIGGEK